MSAPDTRETGTPRGTGHLAPEPNRHGRAHAMTVFSPLRPGGVLLLRLVLAIGRLGASSSNAVRRLAFIHFVRLVIIRHFPDHGQGPEHVRRPLLMFESNYDGTFSQYIDVFAEEVPLIMRAFWGTSYGFPGVKPVSPFKAYIRANEFTADHYYSAYPTATTSMVDDALRLQDLHAEFHRRAGALDPERFREEYRVFLTRVQGLL